MIDNIKFRVRNGNEVLHYSGEIEGEFESLGALIKEHEQGLKDITSKKVGIEPEMLVVDFIYRKLG